MLYSKLIFLFLLVFVSTERLSACTGIVKKAENGDWVYGRTLEFGANLISFDLLFAPRGIEFTAETNGPEQKGMQWKSKYAHVGFSPFGMPLVADGLNEKGLACGAFYFPGWAEYQQASNESAVISNLDVVSWILSNFATLEEVVAAIRETKVIGLDYKPWGIIPPLHYIVVDREGNKAVFEYVKGQLNIHDASIGTITNSPTYDWHLTNARNYIGLSTLNHPSVKVEGIELASFGQGSGAIGLPGDFSPPSRFIRATFLNQVTLLAKNGLEGVARTFKILNQFDIPKGAVKENKDNYEETQWTSAADLSNGAYFYHTAENPLIRFVSLKDLDLDAKSLQSIAINEAPSFINVSKRFKNK